jgi:hypothetical protein
MLVSPSMNLVVPAAAISTVHEALAADARFGRAGADNMTVT